MSKNDIELFGRGLLRVLLIDKAQISPRQVCVEKFVSTVKRQWSEIHFSHVERVWATKSAVCQSGITLVVDTGFQNSPLIAGVERVRGRLHL